MCGRPAEMRYVKKWYCKDCYIGLLNRKVDYLREKAGGEPVVCGRCGMKQDGEYSRCISCGTPLGG